MFKSLVVGASYFSESMAELADDILNSKGNCF